MFRVVPTALKREPTLGWADGVLVLPRGTLKWELSPRMGGCGVQRYSHGTLEWEPTHVWAVVTEVFPLPLPARAVTLLFLLSSPFLGISTSGCSVQRYSHGTLEWEPTHGRAVVTRVVPTAPSSESCDLVGFVVLPFPWDLHLMVWPLSPAGFIVFLFFFLLLFFLFVCFFFFPWHLSFSTVIQCDGCRTTPSVGSLGWYFGFASHGWIARTSRHPTSIRDVVVKLWQTTVFDQSAPGFFCDYVINWHVKTFLAAGPETHLITGVWKAVGKWRITRLLKIRIMGRFWPEHNELRT